MFFRSKRLILSVAVAGMSALVSTAHATSPTLSIPDALDPTGIANASMAAAGPYVTTAVGIGMVLVFAVALYRLVARKASRVGK